MNGPLWSIKSMATQLRRLKLSLPNGDHTLHNKLEAAKEEKYRSLHFFFNRKNQCKILDIKKAITNQNCDQKRKKVQKF